jgi:hypothetical protein
MIQQLRDNLYVLVEFPEDNSFFEENDIGYPSFNSEDNGARYVPEYDYIRHFQKDPAPNSCFRPLRWPESQPYLFPDEPNESISDEKGLADFGEQAVWVPLCNLKNDLCSKPNTFRNAGAAPSRYSFRAVSPTP